MFNKILLICYHRQGFPNSIRGRGYFPQQGEWEILLDAKQQPQQLQTKNKYVYTGIINTVFQRFTIFILHKSNEILIFLRKIDLLISFIVLFYPGYVFDFMMYHDTQFISFPKIQETTFTNQFNLLIFQFRFKTNFFQ